MRKLTLRERVLLVLLAIIVVVSAYILLFYIPVTGQIEGLQAQIQQDEQTRADLENKLTEMQQMQQALTSAEARPYMPEYDNLQAVMVELNSILANCQQYTISFQGDEPTDSIYRRKVTIPFVCANYQQAHTILQQLHDGPLRSMLNDVQLSLQDDGLINGSVLMTFFEYQQVQPDAAAETDEENAE